MREFGFTNPVLIDEEDGIIAGHGRVLAAHVLGLDEVPCIVLAHLTPTQRRAYVLADNKLALNAGWDLEMLSLEIGELGEAGFDLSLTGFDEFELGELFAERTQGRTDPDDAPEPPAHPVAEPGDLWVLGRSSIALRRHRPRPLPLQARAGFCFHLLRYPNYGALTSTPAGLSPAEHASLRWTHNQDWRISRIRLSDKTSRLHPRHVATKRG